ncbi:helix-turn-helix transcriptional regulator [Schaalia sp. HMT-877]|nr:DNA-binding helix-turn-helix protein [Actinomyces sp. oral taxon 877 str. F0543]WLD80917.1 helix-turn-helix transcriptional regulator [Schaalia sp. HMT-877]
MATGSREVGSYGKTVATLLKETQEAGGKSLRALAEEVHISAAQLSRQLNGHRTITLDELARISDALGLDPYGVLVSAERRIAAESGREEEAAPAPKPATPAPASSTGYRTRWAGVRELPRLGPTPEEQERMAARLSDPRGRGGLPDDWGEEPQA